MEIKNTYIHNTNYRFKLWSIGINDLFLPDNPYIFDNPK